MAMNGLIGSQAIIIILLLFTHGSKTNENRGRLILEQGIKMKVDLQPATIIFIIMPSTL